MAQLGTLSFQWWKIFVLSRFEYFFAILWFLLSFLMQSWKPSIWGKSIPRFWKHGACCWTAMAATWSDGKNSQRRQSAWTFMATCPALGASLIRRGWCHCRECKYMVSLYYVILCDVMCLIFPQLKSLKLEFTTVQWICRGHQWKHLLWFEPRAGKNTFSRVFCDPERGIHQGELDATSFAEPGAQQKTRRPESGKRMGWLDDSTREMAFNSMTSYDMTWWVSWTHCEVLVNSESWPFWPSWPSWQTSGCPPSKVGLMQSLEVFEQLLQF